MIYEFQPPVILLDGNQRSSLATVRSLGKRGIRVLVGEETANSISSRSKYCAEKFQYISASRSTTGFIESIVKVALQNQGGILFPMTDATLSLILQNKKTLLKYVIIPYPDYSVYSYASDKEKLFRLAKKHDVPMPKTIFSSDYQSIEELVKAIKDSEFEMPLVLKPALSDIRTSDGWVKAGVCYARNYRELKTLLKNDTFFRYPFLIQERVIGPGVGVFLLMSNGNIIAKSAHQRIREKPPTGGVSVICKSIYPPDSATHNAVKLLNLIKWQSVAMVEFKKDEKENIFKLMEINARFWGSLQLAILSGVDFPYLLYKLATGSSPAMPPEYKVGVQSRWELGDLDHLLTRLKSRKILSLPVNASSLKSTVGSFISDFFNPSVRNEIFKINDLKPFFFEFKNYLKSFLKNPDRAVK